MQFIARSPSLQGKYVAFEAANNTHARKIAHYYRTDAFVHPRNSLQFSIEDVLKKEMQSISWEEFQNTKKLYILQTGFDTSDTIECREAELQDALRKKSGVRNGFLLTVTGLGRSFCKKIKNVPEVIYGIKEAEESTQELPKLAEKFKPSPEQIERWKQEEKEHIERTVH